MPYDHHSHRGPSRLTTPFRTENEPLLVLGETTFRNGHHRFGLLPADRLRHVWVVGKTGSGKSTLLASMVAADLARGHGLALLDPHGDLVEAVLPFIPESRTNDVLVLAPQDVEHPVSFNVFRNGRAPHGDPALLTAQLVSVMKKQWRDSWGPRLEHVLRNAILAVAHDQRATLLFLYRFLTDEALRATVVEKITDPVVRDFWTREFPGYRGTLQSEAVAPVLNKLGAFIGNPVVRNIVGQERSRVDIESIMETRGVLLANLAAGSIGEDASHLLGGMLLSLIHLAAAHRPRGGPPFFVYVDEFQHVVTDALSTMLAEARKFGIGLVLAHQYLGQLPETIRDGVVGNVGTAIVFRVGAHDAAFLAPEFAPQFTADDLASLGAQHVVVKMVARGAALPPFSARTLPPLVPPPHASARAAAVRAQSRLRYARPHGSVERLVSASFPPQ